MNILLSLGFEGGEETGRPISPPPQIMVKPVTRKMFCGQTGLEVVDQFYFLDKY